MAATGACPPLISASLSASAFCQLPEVANRRQLVRFPPRPASNFIDGGRRVNYAMCRTSPIERFQNIPHSNRVFELVPGQQSRKPLRTLKSQAGY